MRNVPSLASPHLPDSEGDACDLDDGLIYLRFADPEHVEWQPEAGFIVWNLSRGDLSVLRNLGIYTQAPGSNGITLRRCSLVTPSVFDLVALSPGESAFYLVTGFAIGGESGLGFDSMGQLRTNDNPCP